MEILHKAKDIKTGEWVEGYYCRYQPHASEEKYVHGIVPIYASALYIIEVNPETVCAYTGMKDKDGKRIWENDIFTGDRLNIGVDRKYLIKYSEEESCLKIKEFEYGEEYYANKTVLKKFKIESNLFDNPELLERIGKSWKD